MVGPIEFIWAITAALAAGDVLDMPSVLETGEGSLAPLVVGLLPTDALAA